MNGTVILLYMAPLCLVITKHKEKSAHHINLLFRMALFSQQNTNCPFELDFICLQLDFCYSNVALNLTPAFLVSFFHLLNIKLIKRRSKKYSRKLVFSSWSLQKLKEVNVNWWYQSRGSPQTFYSLNIYWRCNENFEHGIWNEAF